MEKYAVRFSSFILICCLVVQDYIAVILAEQVAIFIRNFVCTNTNSLHISWLNFWVVFPALYLLFIHINQLYSRHMPFYREVEQLFKACCYSTVLVVFVLYVVQITVHISKLFIVLFSILVFVFITLFRYLAKRFLSAKKLLQIPVLVIGAGKTAELLAKGITSDAGFGYKIVGLLEDNKVSEGILRNFPVLGTFGEAENIIRATGVKRVFIAAPGMDYKKLGMLIYRIQPLVENIGIIPNLVGVPTGLVEVETLFNEKLLILRLKNNLAKPLNCFFKLIFDYTLTIIGSLIILPILIFIGVWIYKDSPGPIIFRHIRIGKNGKAFPCYKFRTMCVDAKETLAELLKNDQEAYKEWKNDFKLKNDPRITKSGVFLRKTSLDELPQIINVLRGEMSLVGPRPVIQEELERYHEFVGDYMMVRPGITGLWQVNGRSDTTYDERVQMDSWYVRNWSVWLDVMLLWKTVKSVIKCKGAY